ncbi:MAG: DUF4115 domain-containing protein [Rhodobacteraceae bacterium]|nr:DUF4115 domain-containing protein [Paracoccaceae bacterium]
MSRRKPAEPKVEGGKSLKGFDDFELRLGDIMRGERATMGKSLLDVQRDLKIKATYIAAIENADPTAFESPGFVAGYVRSYARYLKMDPEWAYKTFCEEGNFTSVTGTSPGLSDKPVKKKQLAVTAPSGLRDPLAEPKVSFVPAGEAALSRIEPGAIGSVAVLIALVGAIGYGGWSVLQEVQKVRFTPVEQAPGVVSQLQERVQATEMAEAGAPASNVALPTAEALDRLYRPQALDVPVFVSRDGPIAAIDPASVGSLAPPPPEPLRNLAVATPAFDLPQVGEPVAPEELAVQVVAGEPQNVILFAVRPAWVRVQAAGGTVIFEKILDAGEQFEIPATEEPPVLRAGNAGSVYFTVGGETYGPAGDGTSVVRNVTLAPQAVTDSYAVADIDRDEDLKRFVDVAEAQAE